MFFGSMLKDGDALVLQELRGHAIANDDQSDAQSRSFQSLDAAIQKPDYIYQNIIVILILVSKLRRVIFSIARKLTSK